VIAADVVAHDITERKKAEDLLRDLSSRHEAILAAVPEIIVEVDNNKVYTWANSVAFQFFGEDVIGKEASLYFEGEQDTYETARPLFKGSENVIYLESWQRRKDGEKRLLAWWCRGLKDSSGRVAGALSSARDITEFRRAEEKIRASLQEKDILISEIHHRVKNNLQVISSLLGLQARSSGNPELTEMFNGIQDRIRSMAMIHETLYDTKDFARIELSSYVKALSQSLFNTHNINPGKINLTIQTDGEIYVDITKAIPCGLILNELISNALKHAFPGGRKGNLQIIISETKNTKIDIVVRDNGVGLPDNIDISEPQTLGLELVNGLVSNQLNGQIEIRRNRGTEMRLKFPL
jgi:PAS domain S-box-containing protein